jgi:hypothetical protein
MKALIFGVLTSVTGYSGGVEEDGGRPLRRAQTLIIRKLVTQYRLDLCLWVANLSVFIEEQSQFFAGRKNKVLVMGPYFRGGANPIQGIGVSIPP